MPVNIGGIDLTAVNVGGTTEIKRIYVGNQYAWPGNATAKVEWIGSVVTSGNTNTFPAHEPGDLLVVAACAGTNSVPGMPTGFTSALTDNIGIALRIGWKVATTSNTPVGTWTGAVWNTAYVFRNANTTTPFGGIAATSETKATSATITMTDTTGDSLLCYGFHNNGTSGSWGATPAGYINKNTVARMANLQKIDSGSDGKLTWSSTAGLVNFKNWVFEVLPGEDAPVEVPQELYAVEQVNQPGRVVDFTAKKGFVPEGEALQDEAFMFRCSTISGLDGYVPRTFSKTFPSGTAYTRFDCTLEDLYGDGVPTSGFPKAKISFQATPTA